MLAPAWRCAIADASGSIERDIEATALGETIEQGLLIESLHLDQPVDRVARAVERERPVGLTGHRAHRRRYSIGAVRRFRRSFRLARDVPQFDGREIDVVEADGAFQLVGAIAGQPDRADVRVDPLDWTGREPVGGWRRQKGDDIALHGRLLHCRGYVPDFRRQPNDVQGNGPLDWRVHRATGLLLSSSWAPRSSDCRHLACRRDERQSPERRSPPRRSSISPR